MNRRAAPFHYRWALVGLFVLASLIAIAMELLHAHLNIEVRYDFLVRNLGLAWVPLIAAGLASAAAYQRLARWLVALPFSLVWLVFFPNTFYMLTDFQHLEWASVYLPYWFDVMLIVWFAWTGLLLGVASLFLMHELVARITRPWLGWLFAMAATLVGGFGVYLGRFVRWSSWDILHQPFSIFQDILEVFTDPLSNQPVVIFVVFYALLFLFVYVAVHLIGGALRQRVD